MENKIQLQHPAGKKAIKIDQDKFELLSSCINSSLQKKALTHKELTDAVITFFEKKKIKFEGSVEWYLEHVKLHLEANNIVERIKEDSKLKFKLTK